MITFKEFLHEDDGGGDGATSAGDVSGPGGYTAPDSKLFSKLAKRKKPGTKAKKKKKKKKSS